MFQSVTIIFNDGSILCMKPFERTDSCIHSSGKYETIPFLWEAQTNPCKVEIHSKPKPIQIQVPELWTMKAF